MSNRHLCAAALMPADDLARIREASKPDQLPMLHVGATCDGPEWRIDTVRGHLTSTDVRRLVQVCDAQAAIIARMPAQQPLISVADLSLGVVQA
jgi:hypothetical protein